VKPCWLVALLSTAAFAGGTIEGTITVKVNGTPTSARNAFVWLEGFKTEPPDKKVVIKQSGRTFTPAVSGVVRGQQVEFENDEPLEDIYHHVFTTTPGANRFNSKLFKPKNRFDTHPLTRFGRVDVFCDIHKNMYATVWVVPNDRFAVVSEETATAKFRLEGVKPGKWTILGWHRANETEVSQPVEVEDGKVTRVDLVIDGTTGIQDFLARHKHSNGDEYKPKPDGGYVGEKTGAAW
jgi:plastocyanin